VDLCRGTSARKKHNPLGPSRRPVPRILWGSKGGALFLVSEVPLYSYGGLVPRRVARPERTCRTIQGHLAQKEAPPPQDHHRALGIFLLKGSSGRRLGRLLLSEAPLQSSGSGYDFVPGYERPSDQVVRLGGLDGAVAGRWADYLQGCLEYKVTHF
jgi:hypothetical protein